MSNVRLASLYHNMIYVVREETARKRVRPFHVQGGSRNACSIPLQAALLSPFQRRSNAPGGYNAVAISADATDQGLPRPGMGNCRGTCRPSAGEASRGRVADFAMRGGRAGQAQHRSQRPAPGRSPVDEKRRQMPAATGKPSSCRAAVVAGSIAAPDLTAFLPGRLEMQPAGKFE